MQLIEWLVFNANFSNISAISWQNTIENVNYNLQKSNKELYFRVLDFCGEVKSKYWSQGTKIIIIFSLCLQFAIFVSLTS
jgi:hypothetical protein